MAELGLWRLWGLDFGGFSEAGLTGGLPVLRGWFWGLEEFVSRQWDVFGVSVRHRRVLEAVRSLTEGRARPCAH